MNVKEFIQRGGKIEFLQTNCGFKLTFPNGYTYTTTDCMTIEETITRCSNAILTDRYEKLFTPKAVAGEPLV